MTQTASRAERVPGLIAPRELIAGDWSEPALMTDHHLHDQATGARTQDGVYSDHDRVDTAVAAAWDAHLNGPGAFDDRAQRAAVLQLASDYLTDVTQRIAVQDSLNSGVPITITRLFAQALPAVFRSAAAHLRDTEPVDLSEGARPVALHRLPLGPCAVFAPWNAPTAVAGKKAAYAWGAGCPVIIKPSPWAPHGTTLLVEAMQRAATDLQLDSSAVQLVFGGAPVGQQLASDPRIRAISFTGSRQGGRAVAAASAAGMAALQMELGSNNPAVVLDDADITATAAALASGMTKLNGAWCESPGTVFVPAKLRESLIGALTAALETHQFGSPLDEATTYGPQSNVDQFRGLVDRTDLLAGAGARVIHVGNLDAVPASGFWIAPMLVIDPPPDLVRDEFFGPLLIVRTCETPIEAIQRSHELNTGLAGYVFGEDLAHAMEVGRRLPAGEVKINGTSLLDLTDRSTQEFWYGSGVGGHGDTRLARFFTGARIVGLDVDSPL
jgi:betaine-aldehyde dehydrogenase